MIWLTSNSISSKPRLNRRCQKKAVYELGCCFDAMGKEAVEKFKLVYSAGVSFEIFDKVAFLNQGQS